MTIDSTYSREEFLAQSGGSPLYTFTFELLESDDITVEYRDDDGNVYTVSPSEYTVTANIDPSQPTAQGGTVSFAGAHPNYVTRVTVIRSTDLTQLIDYAPYTPFPADSHELALDKLTLIAQENRDRIQLLEDVGPPVGQELGQLESFSIALEDGQTEVSFPGNVPTLYGAFYLGGIDVDNGRLVENVDYTKNSLINGIELTDSYPAGSTITVAYYDSPSARDVIVVDTVADLATLDAANGTLIKTRGYYAVGDGGQAEYIAETANSPDGYGDHLLGSGNQASLQHDGMPHVKQFGVDGTDDSFPYEACVAYCSSRRISHSIGGAIVNCENRGNSDPNYDPFLNQFNTYGFKLGAGGYYRVEGSGTITMSDPNGDEHWALFEDCDYVGFGPGVELDGNIGKITPPATTIGGGVPYLAGVWETDLGSLVVRNAGAIKVCSSPLRPSEYLRYDNLLFEDGWASNCLTGKPGGIRFVEGGNLTSIRCFGGANWETEDVHGHGHTVVQRVVTGSYIAVDMDADKTNPGNYQAYVVVIQDSPGALYQLGSIQLWNGSAQTGNVGALKVDAGQTDEHGAYVHVDSISVKGSVTCLDLTRGEDPGGVIHIGSIYADQVATVVECLDSTAYAVNSVGPLEELRIDHIYAKTIQNPSVTSRGELMRVENRQPGLAGYLIEKLTLGSVHVEQCQSSSLTLSEFGVRDVEIDSLIVEDVVAHASGQFYGFNSLYAVCETFRVHNQLKVLGAPNTGVNLVVSDRCSIKSLYVDQSVGAAVHLRSSSAKFYFDDISCLNLADNVPAINWDAGFTGELHLHNVDFRGSNTPDALIGNSKRADSITGRVQGYMTATISAWAVGTIAAGGTVTLNSVSLPGVLLGDVIEVTPAANPGGSRAVLLIRAEPTSFGVVQVVMINPTSSNIAPSTVDWVMKAHRTAKV